MEPITKNPEHPPVAVAHGTMSGGDSDMEYTSSCRSMDRYDAQNCRHLMQTRGAILDLITGPRLNEGRTQTVEQLLQTQADVFLFTDDDMAYPADALCRLLGHMYDNQRNRHPRKPARHIIGGLCFAGGRSGRLFPTIYESYDDEGNNAVRPFTQINNMVHEGTDYPRDELIKAGATGAAFMIVHRHVFQHMKKPWPEGFGTFPAVDDRDKDSGIPQPYPWFIDGVTNGRPFGEDVAFCQRARALGYETYIDTACKIDHMKKVPLNEQMWDLWLEVIALRKEVAALKRDQALPRLQEIKV